MHTLSALWFIHYCISVAKLPLACSFTADVLCPPVFAEEDEIDERLAERQVPDEGSDRDAPEGDSSAAASRRSSGDGGRCRGERGGVWQWEGDGRCRVGLGGWQQVQGKSGGCIEDSGRD